MIEVLLCYVAVPCTQQVKDIINFLSITNVNYSEYAECTHGCALFIYRADLELESIDHDTEWVIDEEYVPTVLALYVNKDFKGICEYLNTIPESNESLLIHLNTHVLEMIHHQDCCESVYLADVVGSFEDLIGYPLLEVTESLVDNEVDGYESSTASYYNFKTVKANVQLRWIGESNGYYSETVDSYLYTAGV